MHIYNLTHIDAYYRPSTNHYGYHLPAGWASPLYNSTHVCLELVYIYFFRNVALYDIYYVIRRTQHAPTIAPASATWVPLKKPAQIRYLN